MEKEFYSCKEVAERYGVREDTVWSWIREGKLHAVKVGKQYRIKKETLLKMEKG